jgi:hypothetical protein
MDLIIIIPLIVGIYIVQRKYLLDKLSRTDVNINKHFFDLLFILHMLMGVAYLLYAYATTSDSFRYYRFSAGARTWGQLWGTGTMFINFLAYPFTNFFGLSFNSVMMIFSFFGFQGVVLFYRAARENITGLPIRFFGLTILELLFLLPNMHFWSASLGKGSVMTFAIGLTIFGLSRFNRRFMPMIAGSLLIYMIRPHILFVILLGIGMGALLNSKGLKWSIKAPLIALSLIAVLLVSDDVVEFAGTESVNVFESSSIAHRASELGKSSSGVDISNYNQVMKLFTFLYRPLFVDSPGVMGLVTSVENLILLFLTVQLIMNMLQTWTKWNGFFQVGLFIFLLGALALAQVTGNLGIAIRQKAQIIPLFFMAYSYSVALRRSMQVSNLNPVLTR